MSRAIELAVCLCDFLPFFMDNQRFEWWIVIDFKANGGIFGR